MAVLNAWWPAVLAILVLVGLCGVGLVLRSRRGAPKSQRRVAGTSSVEAGDTLAAWSPTATRVLTRSEREAYHVLRKALPEHMVLAQVPLARFLRVPTRNSYSEWLRRVGSICADLVVCDDSSQVIAVIELRQPVKQEKPRTVRRHARMDRVLAAAGIPVYVWLEGALPGPAVAREAVLGAALTMPKRQAGTNSLTRRSAEAAAVVASMQSAGAMHGMSVNEDDNEFNPDDFADDEAERKEPPPSTWFDDLESSPVPLEEAATSRH